MSAYRRVVEALEQHGSKGRGTSWQCVAHEDRAPSLSVTNGNKGVVITCHAGCSTEDVVAALGLSMSDLFNEPLEKRVRPQVVAEYPYYDEQGTLLYTVKRLEPGYDGERKTFRQFRPDGTAGVKGIRRVPYQLPQVIEAARNGATIFVLEGEKDVATAEGLGVAATCNVGGAGKWHDDYTRHLVGAAEVVVIADRDEPGRKHAAAVADSVRRAGIPVRVLEPAQGKDFTDHVSAGLGYDDLVPMETPDSRPTNPTMPSSAQDVDSDRGSGISGTRILDTGWDEPLSVDAATLPAFPSERLGLLGKFVTATAASLQTPEDLVGFAALATISTATGGRVRVQVKPDWHESTALYMAALADSSEKKTPALNAAAAPIREIEDELIEEHRPEVEATAQEVRITTARMTKAEQAAAGDNADKRAAAEADAEAARTRLAELGEAPELPRLLVRDITLEALGKRMYEQNGRIGSLASEGGLFKVAAGLYGSNGKANTDLLLEAYTGGPYTIDRTGRSSSRMASTFLALGLVVQPGIVAGLEKQNPEFRQSGLLGRFLYARPAPTAEDTFDSPAVPLALVEDYRSRIRALVTQLWDSPTTHTMTLSAGARQAFADYYNAFAKRRKPGGDLYDLADWAGKLRGQLIRVAACLALFEDPQAREISTERMNDVLSMAPYFIAHARAVFDLMGRNQEGKLKPLRDVLGWLSSRKDPRADFSARDAWQALKGREWAEDMDAMNDTLLQLEEHGWIAFIPPPDTQGRRGRKPSPKFAVHPWIANPKETP
ncbi:DUF3987 domain-containing protein [Streptomyces sp. NRRL F-5630]|uniref:YfjI family protein n=1 Tax=Streptomyces sp. NRRL F-5630 TaxID=1463864 RepID=UPI003EBB6CD3